MRATPKSKRDAIGTTDRMRNLRCCGFASGRDYRSNLHDLARRESPWHLTSSIAAASCRRSTAFMLASLHISLFLFEQKETLSRLPLLIREFAGRRFQKMMVVGCGSRLIVKGIVCGCPKEVG